MKKITVSIFGCGSRGEIYASIMKQLNNKFEIVSACDLKQIRLDQFKEKFNISKDNLFIDDDIFFSKKRSDVLVVSVQDKDHVRFSKLALELGYNLLLEKPISDSYEELNELLEYKKKYNKKVIVCHVLRYAPAYKKIKELLDSKICGDLVKIDAIEQVCFWHHSHSYVRGNWHNTKKSTPMIMAKCCHDLDLLQYFANSKCEYISSFGDNVFFNKKHMPYDASECCTTCKYKDTCPFSAEYVYIKRWKEQNCPVDAWPYNIITDELPLTEEKIRKGFETSNYGKCVFACDNDTVDYQDVSMLFFNGVEANLTMTALTANGGRRYTFHLTHGEITLKEDEDLIEMKEFAKPVVQYRISDLINQDNNMGHGGGDAALINKLYDLILNDDENGTTLEASIESHLMALKAEESRLTKKMVKVHE